MKLIIVESPTKARTLSTYLKNESTTYKVLASYGHIRALSRKKGSINVDDDFSMTWENIPKSSSHVSKIIEYAKNSNEIILATDPDREGEAIAWHLCNILSEAKINSKLSRMTFHSITPKAIKESLNNLKEIDKKLVDAYMARLGLDYLVGFNISPILWRKLPGSKSAGRVQSAALRIITDRENEIECFVPQDYWTLHATFSQNAYSCTATLTEWQNKKVDKFMWNASMVSEALGLLKKEPYKVADFKHKLRKINPYPPLITSTLQQEAANRLGWKPIFTMKVAQKLYEGIKLEQGLVGLITYMRTDSVTISQQGIDECRNIIKSNFGNEYLPETPNKYVSKVRNAQEAHEAIRPTNFSHTPESIRQYLDADQFKLYELIWKRSISSQMSPSVYESCNMIIKGNISAWQAHGVKIKFDGFQKLYGVDKSENSDVWLFEEGDVKCTEITDEKHQTKPPARFTETSLIKYLEDKGIGRPSTYANILYVLDAREYVVKQNKSLIPSNLGWLVSGFLKQYFSLYVQDDFTSALEDKLDMIAKGEKDWKKLLEEFWTNFKVQIDNASQLDIKDVLKNISHIYSQHFFQSESPKSCPNCDGQQELRISKGNGFLCCSNYPDCKWTKSVDSQLEQDEIIGIDQDGYEILLKHGRYGYYLQWGKTEVKSRLILPKMFAPPNKITLDDALKLKELPKIIGHNPENGEEIKVGIGQFGPWILYKNTYVSLKINPFEVTLEECLNILDLPRNKKKIETKNKEITETKPKTRQKKVK